MVLGLVLPLTILVLLSKLLHLWALLVLVGVLDYIEHHAKALMWIISFSRHSNLQAGFFHYLSCPGSPTSIHKQQWQDADPGVRTCVLTIEPHWLKWEQVADFPLCFLVFSRFSTVASSLIFIKKKGGGGRKNFKKVCLIFFF